MGKIEDTFGMRSLEEALKDLKGPTPEAPQDEVEDDYDPFTLPTGLDRSLALQVEEGAKTAMGERLLAGLETDERLDHLHDRLIEHAETLAELALELDPGKAPRAFEVMNAIMKNAMDAVTSKRDHELKTMRLMLDQAKFEHSKNAVDPTAAAIPEQIVAVMTTADLVRKFRKEIDEANAVTPRSEPTEPTDK